MIYYAATFITMWLLLRVCVAVYGKEEEIERPYIFIGKLLVSSVATFIFFIVVQVLSFILELLEGV